MVNDHSTKWVTGRKRLTEDLAIFIPRFQKLVAEYKDTEDRQFLHSVTGSC